jgi:hypothetical protein
MSKFYDYKLRYRTLDQLIDSVSDDWENLDRENVMEPSRLIKVVRKINKELGLRITKTKEVLISFENGMVNLPDDMEHLNYAVICGSRTISVGLLDLPTNMQHENKWIDCLDEGCCTRVYMNCCGQTWQVVESENQNGNVVHYSYPIQARVSIKHSLYHVNNCEVTGVITSPNFMKMNIPSGKIYLNYEGILEDEEGNLLVLDHPLINDYYEYAIKRRVLENMYFDASEDMERKLQLIEFRYRDAKKQALTLVNTPDYKELEEISDLNRRAGYIRFYSMFS